MIRCTISMFGHVVNGFIGVDSEIGRVGGDGDGRSLFPRSDFGFGESGLLNGLGSWTGWSKGAGTVAAAGGAGATAGGGGRGGKRSGPR